MIRPGTVAGRCYVCRLPVVVQVATRVRDYAASAAEGRSVKRLAHRGACAMELEHRIGGR